MEKLQKYREIIREVLTEQAHPYAHSNHVDTEIICDTEHDHYQLTYIGWQEQKRIFSLILCFDIKDEKIWVQYNGTETAIAQILIEKESLHPISSWAFTLPSNVNLVGMRSCDYFSKASLLRNLIMDRLNHYRQSISKFLSRYVDVWQEEGIEAQLIIDSERDTICS